MSAEPAGAPLLRGRWFDGRSTAARAVLVALESGTHGPRLRLHPLDAPEAALVLESHQVGWPEAWSAARAPRSVVADLREHGSLQIDDVAHWRTALAAAGECAPLAQRMQTRWPVFLGVLLLAAASLGAFYRWGTPWAATQITRQVPLGWEQALSAQALRELDEALLKPSRLGTERQAELRRRFEQLTAQMAPELARYRGYAPPLSLSFRAGMGANAFALPGGTIVMTDALVEAAERLKLGDDALVGVLAHEIGHVVHRHTTRMVVEQGVLNIGLGVALGDVSGLLSTGASVLTGLAYRRSHEGEADCFALALMQRAGLPTAPMADLLAGVERQEAGGTAQNGRSATAWAALLSSHPQTAERARVLRSGHRDHCRW